MQTEKINEIREAHLTYVRLQINCIHYGGVIQDEANDYKGILMIIKANNIDEATDFIKNDPYFSLYSRYEVSLFSQRIPKI